MTDPRVRALQQALHKLERKSARCMIITFVEPTGVHGCSLEGGHAGRCVPPLAVEAARTYRIEYANKPAAVEPKRGHSGPQKPQRAPRQINPRRTR